MASFKHLEMGKSVTKHPNISIQTSFFGLCTTRIYTPTGSKVRPLTHDYSPETGRILESILDCDKNQLEAMLQRKSEIAETTLGNMRLEVALSDDHQFVAVQLFRFVNLLFEPVTDVKFYEGREAELIAGLL